MPPGLIPQPVSTTPLPATGSPPGDQWLRRAELIVTPSLGNEGLDLSNMHFQFEVEAADKETPNIAIIRIYNLLPSTEQKILNQSEFNGVVLSCGYQNGAFGTIFKGTIKQVTVGRINPTDTVCTIYAGDYDGYNFAFMNQTLAAGSTPAQRAAAVVQAMQKEGLVGDDGSPQKLVGGVLPRGKVLFGLARNQMRQLAVTTGHDWSVQNGVLQMVPKTGVKPGQAVVMNSQTGMIGVPEQTNNGIMVRCLLNPNLQVGTLLRINNADINQTQIHSQGFPAFTDVTLLASLNRFDGLYRIFVVEVRGDTRGNEWYSELICLSAPDSKVALYG